MLDLAKQVKYSYAVTLVGVALMAIAGAYGIVRAFAFRGMFGPRTGFPPFARQFGNANPFGVMSNVTILAVVIAIVGVVWLGLTMMKSHKS